jgi:two-component system response regulator NreC
LDYRMPRLNGVEAASIIKKELPQVRIVLFTLYEQSISKPTIAAAHIDMVLSKPDGVDSLLESIQALMATDRPV